MSQPPTAFAIGALGSTTSKSCYLPPPELGVSSLSLAPFGSGRAFGFAVVPGTVGWPGTGRAASFAGGPSGADPEPVPGGGVICVLGGGLVGPVVCAYALPAITVATAAALISFSIFCSHVVSCEYSTTRERGCSSLSVRRSRAGGNYPFPPLTLPLGQRTASLVSIASVMASSSLSSVEPSVQPVSSSARLTRRAWLRCPSTTAPGARRSRQTYPSQALWAPHAGRVVGIGADHCGHAGQLQCERGDECVELVAASMSKSEGSRARPPRRWQRKLVECRDGHPGH
jgi:hypothetical protein